MTNQTNQAYANALQQATSANNATKQMWGQIASGAAHGAAGFGKGGMG